MEWVGMDGMYGKGSRTARSHRLPAALALALTLHPAPSAAAAAAHISERPHRDPDALVLILDRPLARLHSGLRSPDPRRRSVGRSLS